MRIVDTSLPADYLISFQKLVDFYLADLQSKSDIKRLKAERVQQIILENPELITGIREISDIAKYAEEIDFLLEDLFTPSLQSNEIKIATIPLEKVVLKSTKRFDNIFKDFNLYEQLGDMGMTPNEMYMMGSRIILEMFYGFEEATKTLINLSVPNQETGLMRHYRMMYNADFMSIEKKPNTPTLTLSDYHELIENFEDLELWKEKIPPFGYSFKGFAIGNFFDFTEDFAISEFKSKLLNYDREEALHNEVNPFEEFFRTIFNLNNIRVGYTWFNKDDNSFEASPGKGIPSYLLNKAIKKQCEEVLCSSSFQYVFKLGKNFPISNVDKFFKASPEEHLYTNLKSQGINSAIIAPLIRNGDLLGVIEVVSKEPYVLNTANESRLDYILPHLVDRLAYDSMKFDDEVELTIQKECTSIHPSVYWKFKKESTEYNLNKLRGEEVHFGEIAFEDVYPLFGQMDIKGSSQARNNAVVLDLTIQLKALSHVLERIFNHEQIPIYEYYQFKIQEFLNDLGKKLQVDLEFTIKHFIDKEINSILLMYQENPLFKEVIGEYYALLDEGNTMVYNHRKKYDETVNAVNKMLGALLDEKQKSAQKMHPHFFEKFKSDGVEHNIYIGESITQAKTFHPMFLRNLRLWQIQSICDMENAYYKFKTTLPLTLEVASLILVFRDPLTVKFRLDEKRFDVDGTYNARYEVIKKRVDKALIKGTNERVTVPGKLAIVYSHPEDEVEYLAYVKSMQNKNLLGPEIEIVELEDMQGVTGMKAIRASFLYQEVTEEAIKDIDGVHKIL